MKKVFLFNLVSKANNIVENKQASKIINPGML